MKNLLFALFAVLAIGLASCGGDDCDFKTMTEDADANLVLGTTYTDDPTMENCEAYKTALEAFVADYKDCDDVSIMGQVTATQSAIDLLDCN